MKGKGLDIHKNEKPRENFLIYDAQELSFPASHIQTFLGSMPPLPGRPYKMAPSPVFVKRF